MIDLVSWRSHDLMIDLKIYLVIAAIDGGGLRVDGSTAVAYGKMARGPIKQLNR